MKRKLYIKIFLTYFIPISFLIFVSFIISCLRDTNLIYNLDIFGVALATFSLLAFSLIASILITPKCILTKKKIESDDLNYTKECILDSIGKYHYKIYKETKNIILLKSDFVRNWFNGDVKLLLGNDNIYVEASTYIFIKYLKNI